MFIFIPTLGRVDHQHTWDLLPVAWRDMAVLVVHPAEQDQHRATGREVISCGVQGSIAKVREWIVRFALSQGMTKIGVLDDDLTRLVYTDHPKNIIPGLSWNCETDADDWTEVYAWLNKTLESEALCGLGSAIAPPSNRDIAAPARLMWNHWYNLDLLPVDELDWTSIAYAEDFHVTLQLSAPEVPVDLGAHGRHRWLSGCWP